jgi:hypothetical protein
MEVIDQVDRLPAATVGTRNLRPLSEGGLAPGDRGGSVEHRSVVGRRQHLVGTRAGQNVGRWTSTAGS